MQSFLINATNNSVRKLGTTIRSLRESLGLTREVVDDLGLASNSTLRHIEAGHSCCVFSLVRLVFGFFICLKSDGDVAKFCTHLLALLADLFNLKVENIKNMTLEELVTQISLGLKREHQEFKNNRPKKY
ncbi:helix-turn-helix domain-containing protein [Bacteroides propionicifaciens]|uniref:helix-turn-helix domain-containing protein n=1 Tax=Bacteroides propionicifaciens TaxID=392838 RepID=UPI0003797952|nr:helix-turn-helix transcriptional regulator [Bacteroides propionicifaciens]